MLTQLLRSLGLVAASRYTSVSERLRKSELRIEALSRKLEKAHAELRHWRTKVDESRQRLKEVEEEARRDARRFEKFIAESERQAERDRKRAIDVLALQSRLDAAEHELVVAREHLMAIEVKLDILEGAANVLDGRTRTVLAHRTSEGRGAAV